MKVMRKVLAVWLILATLLGLVACGNTKPNGETQADPTTQTTAPVETTEEPEVFVSTEIIKDGKSEFVIVHDGSAGALSLANKLSSQIEKLYGVKLAVSNAKQTEETTYEIVVGAARQIGEEILSKLSWENDFAMKVRENKLVLCATNKYSYEFLQKYVLTEVFATAEGDDLVMDTEDNVVYSRSELGDLTYIDYFRDELKDILLGKLYSADTFKHETIYLPYRLYVPFNYNPQKKYPLLLNLHGAGLRGTDNQRQIGLIDKAMKSENLTVDDAIIVCPQCPETGSWADVAWAWGTYSMEEVPESKELKAAIALVEELQKTYSIDEKRMYCMGFSMGGYGTWSAMMNHPDMFAGAVPMCGGGDPTRAEAMKHTNVWAVHGVLDKTVPVDGSRKMVAAMKAVGADARLTELPDAGHDVWNYTYAEEEIFKWLFEQKRP